MTGSTRPRRRFDTWTMLTPEGAEVEEYCDCYTFNHAAAKVWISADGSRTTDEIAAVVAEAFGTPVQDCREDVERFVDELVRARLVEMV